MLGLADMSGTWDLGPGTWDPCQRALLVDRKEERVNCNNSCVVR